jgi:hypothetical protein
VLRLGFPTADAVPTVRLLGLGVLTAVLIAVWWQAATRADRPIPAALRGAGLAFAATIALAPSFHPWYALTPLVLLAATTVRTDLIMTVAAFAALLVLPDGGGLARFAKFPGAPLMTLLLVALAVRYARSVRPPNTDPLTGQTIAADELPGLRSADAVVVGHDRPAEPSGRPTGR